MQQLGLFDWTPPPPPPVVTPPKPRAPRKPKLLVERGAIVIPPSAEALKRLAGRRAREAVASLRADQERLAKGVEETSPLAGCAIVRMNVGGRIPGARNFVPTDVGNRKVKMFQPSTGVWVTVDRLSYDRFAAPLSKSQAPRKTVVRIIRERREEAKRLGLRYSVAGAKAALAALRRAA